jgi:recombination protein RecR
MAIEKTGTFRGVYHILHGVLSPMDGIGPEELKIRELYQRISRGEIKEILLATSSTVPGEATASYLADHLHRYPVRVTRLACGIPMGMDIKYADKYTLGLAIDSRRLMER